MAGGSCLLWLRAAGSAAGSDRNLYRRLRPELVPRRYWFRGVGLYRIFDSWACAQSSRRLSKSCHYQLTSKHGGANTTEKFEAYKNIWLHTRWRTIAIRFNGVPKGRWGGVKASGKETSRQGAMYCRMKWSVARKDASERMGLCPLGWSDRPSWLLFSLSACTHSTWAISFFPSDQKIRGTKKFFFWGGSMPPPSSATGCK